MFKCLDLVSVVLRRLKNSTSSANPSTSLEEPKQLPIPTVKSLRNNVYRQIKGQNTYKSLFCQQKVNN